jgi:hypothetical protein
VLDERIAPYVPQDALRRPEGATVDENGLAACVVCKMKVPVAKADIVGMGYRCQPCGVKASIDKLSGRGDASSHLNESERIGLRANGAMVMWGGAGMVVLGALLFLATYIRSGTAAAMIGVIAIAIGFARRKASE